MWDNKGTPGKQGLYDPRNEHDACGIGFVANIKNRKSHQIIRQGLQMECIGCTQCIDACDDIMDKGGLERGLIRYSSENRLAGLKTRLLRVRTVLYPLALLLSFGLLGARIAGEQSAELKKECHRIRTRITPASVSTRTSTRQK